MSNSKTVKSFLKKYQLDFPESYHYLNCTQFFGVLNDNIFKFLLIYLYIDLHGIASSYIILSASGLLYVIPFLIFSAPSGILADKISKNQIVVATKFIELVVVLVGVYSAYTKSVSGCLVALFLLSTQSAIFSPAKYGIIPEIVDKKRVSLANGILTFLTFLAIILGSLFASLILDITQKNFTTLAIVTLVFASIGFYASFKIHKTYPKRSKSKFTLFFPKSLFDTLKWLMKRKDLLTASLGSSFFLFLGAFIQLNLIPFAVNSLGLTDIQGGYLFFLTALGIGIGAILCGRFFKETKGIGVVPISGFLITAILFLLDMFSNNLYASIIILIMLGILGGTFVIPLDIYIQLKSTENMRGQVIALTNFISFVGVLLASGLIYVNSAILDIQAHTAFSLSAILTLIASFLLAKQYFKQMRNLF